MLFNYKLVSLEELYSETNLEVSDQFNLQEVTMESFEEQIQALAHSNKPVITVNSAFYLHGNDLATGAFTKFIVYETPDILIASFVSDDVDGFKIAATAVRWEMFLPPRGTY